MSDNSFRIPGYVLNVAVSAVLLGIFFTLADPKAVWESASGIGVGSYALAVAGMVLALFLNGARWHSYLRGAGFPHPLTAALRIRLIGQGLNIVLPGGVIGDAAQVLLVSRRPRLSAAKVVATVVADRLTALIMVLVVVVIAIPIVAPRWPSSFAVIGGLSAVFAILFLVAVFMSRSGSKPWLRWRRLARIIDFVAATLRALGALLRKPAVLAQGLGFSVASQLILTGSVWLIATDLGDVSYLYMIPTMGVVLLTTVIPITVSGLGVREAVFGTMLAPMGFTLEDGIVISLVWFSATVIPAVILAAGAVLLSPEPAKILGALRGAARSKRS